MKRLNLANKLLLGFLVCLCACWPFFSVGAPTTDTISPAAAEITTLSAPTYYYDSYNQYTRGGYSLSVLDDLGVLDYNQYLLNLSQTSALPEVVIAVIDSGINADHVVFTDRLLTAYAKNFNETAQGKNQDWNYDLSGHGTHVAGIIADSTLSNVKILPIKIFAGTDSETIESQTIKNAIDYVVRLRRFYGLNIVAANLSLGTPAEYAFSHICSKNNDLCAAMSNLRAAGILPVVAAGNGDPVGTGHYYSMPAACKGVLAVSSYNFRSSTRALSTFSNYGPHVSLAGPGDGGNELCVVSASNEGATVADIRRLNGTSMATPFVTLCYAMLMSDVSKTTAETLGIEWSNTVDKSSPYNYLNPQHKALLLAARDVGYQGIDQYYGYGIVNVSSFATNTVVAMPSVDKEDLLNTDTAEQAAAQASAARTRFWQNAFWIFLAAAVLTIFVYALIYRFTGGQTDDHVE